MVPTFNTVLRSISFAFLSFLICSSTVQAQNGSDVGKINSFWDNLDKRYPNLNKKYETHELQKSGTIQTPGNIQIPRGLKAITKKTTGCSKRFVVGADTLFEFDKSTLTSFALDTLKVLAPMIQSLGRHPLKVEGHTDGKGSDEYNQVLSEKRAERVKNWLLENHIGTAGSIVIEGFGKRKPVAPNTKSDGSDNPQGRSLNRRVEIVVDTCKPIEDLEKSSSTSGSEPPSNADTENIQPADLNAASTSALMDGSNTSDSNTSATSAKLGVDGPSGLMNLTGVVDNSFWLPYTNVVSAEEMKTIFTNFRITPLNNKELNFEISLPNSWQSKPLEVSSEVIKNDASTQVPLAQIEPDKGNAIVEVRYLRVPENVSLSSFVHKYADAAGYKLITRQSAQFSERNVEDALLRKPAGGFGEQLTRLTVLRKGPLVMFVASSCPEKEYEQWKRIFAAAALTFNPSAK